MERKIDRKQAVWDEIRGLKLIAEYVPGLVPSTFLNSLVKALSPYATIWLSAQLLEELAGQCRASVLWKWVIATLAVTATMGIMSALLKRWYDTCSAMYDPNKRRIFTDKFFSMDYADVDDQKIRDLRAQIFQNENFMGYGLNRCLENLENLVQSVVGILSGLGLTVTLFISPVADAKWRILNGFLPPLALMTMMALTIWFGAVTSRILMQKQTEMNDLGTLGNRLFTKLFHMCPDGKRRLDIRTYSQEKIIQPTMEESAFVPGGPFDRLYKGPWSMLASAASGTSAIFTGCVYIFACLKAWGGAFGIGSVTQYVGAATALAGNVAMFLETVNFISANAPFMEDTFRLLDTPNAMYQGSLTTEKRSDRQYHVEFRDVSFRYPGTENWALRHVNMKFKVGSRLAIVGENGSGKTTFIKLLCRLYDPQEGQILLNGIDIRKYNYRDYMDIFSVVFQDFQLLPQSLGANVAGSGSYDRERVKKALMDAGFEERMSAMPQGLDTQLYKDFAENGVEVSGGEAQKIAIARALYKDAPFIILDEPTAALDPMAEAEIYGKFNDIVTDKTAIYISHRLSSCKFCDEIAVFDQGQVVQQGTHDGLVEAEGKYRELWNAQAQYYTK